MKNSLISKEKSSANPKTILNRETRRLIIFDAIVCSLLATLPVAAFGSVESSLRAVQDKLVGTLLPLGAMCGLAIAGLSFVAGHANARQHLFYAIIGAIVGFGAESIVSLIQSLVH